MKILHSKFVLAAVALCIAMGVNAQPKFNADATLRQAALPTLTQPQLQFNSTNAQKSTVKTGARKATEGTWTSVGEGAFTDLSIATFLGATTASTYNVTVERNDQDTCIYRLVDPYQNHPLAASFTEAGFAFTAGNYIEVDITDPNNVVLATQNTGWAYDGTPLTIESTAAGTLKNGVITWASATINTVIEGIVNNPNGSMKITLPNLVPSEPWTEWEPFEPAGDHYAQWEYGAWQSGTLDSMEVFVRYSNTEENMAQIKIANWGANFFTKDGVEIIINWNTSTNACRVPAQSTGYTNTYGLVYLADFGDFVGEQYMTYYPCTYDPTSGTFTLNLGYTIASWMGTGQGFGYGVEKMYMNGFTDYTISALNLYYFIENDTASTGKQYFWCKSKDATKFRYTVATQVTSEQDVENIAKALTGDFTDLTSNYGVVEATEGEKFYYVIVASYDNKDNYVGYNFESFFYSPSTGWESLGMADYTDDIVASYYSIDNLTYKVEIQESKTYPGLYRLKNPYGAGFAYNESTNYREDVYMYFNATNPAAVSVKYPSAYQKLGINWGKGEMNLAQLSAGTMVDGVITFPTKGLAIYQGESGSYANYSGLFKLVLPRDTVAVTAAAGKATFYSDYKTIVPAGYAKTYTYNAGDNFVQEDASLKADQVLPANTGIVFEPAAEVEADTIYTFIHTAQAPDSCTSALSGVVVETAISDFTGSTIYTLANGTNGLGLYPFTGETLAAHKAFLAVPLGADVKFIALDQETGINSVKANANVEGTIFNLAGQRVEKLQKGVNIVNGKKVIF